MSWEKLPALPSRHNPCLHCPPILAKADMDKVIAVGFGSADVTCDGRLVYEEPSANHGTLPCPACEWGEVDGKDCVVCSGSGRVDDPTAEEAVYWTFEDAERAAAADPDHDWRVTMFGPLHGESYQRQGTGEWMLVESNQGFA